MDRVRGVVAGADPSKVVIIMRGLPGSGKSYLSRRVAAAAAEAVQAAGDTTPVFCSADHYFERPDGSYAFNPSQLVRASRYYSTLCCSLWRCAGVAV